LRHRLNFCCRLTATATTTNFADAGTGGGNISIAGGAVTDAIATTLIIVAMVAAEIAIEPIVTTTATDGAGAKHAPRKQSRADL
jgi:hypothetical protein